MDETNSLKGPGRTKRCSWGQCNSDSRYATKRKEMEAVFFIPFPKPKTKLEKCMRWIKACNRPTYQLNVNKIKDHHYVCSKHFKGGNGPTDDDPDPIRADPYSAKDKTTPKRKAPTTRVATPQHKKRKILDQCATNEETTKQQGLSACPPPSSSTTATSGNNGNAKDSSKYGVPITSTSITCVKCNHSYSPSSAEIKRMARGTFVRAVLENDASCFRYTGVPNIKMLTSLFKWIEPVAKKIKLWEGKKKTTAGKTRGRKRVVLSLFEEYVLTLVRIRRGYDTQHLAYLFGLSQSHISRICIAWFNVLSRCLEQTIIWPSKAIVSGNLPQTFSEFNKTRVIIDCTEWKIEKPFRPRAQRATWSSYKHSNTCKMLVGISPNGTITFLSKLYSGSISDATIVSKSGFLDKIEAGDDVMADRGFNVRNLLLEKKATLNLPAFSHGKVLSQKAGKKSRKIAAVRIHVERAIQRMKTFKIMTGVIPLKSRFHLNQISTIIAALCNMQGRLA